MYSVDVVLLHELYQKFRAHPPSSKKLWFGEWIST